MTKIVTRYFKDTEIDKNITMVGKDAISLQQKIHNLAISTLLIWHDAGDDIKINRYLPFDYSDEVNGWFCHKDNSVLKGKQFIAARDNPFWTLKPLKTVSAVTCVDDIIKSVEKNSKRRNVAENKRHVDDNLLTYSQECRILDILKEGDNVVVEENVIEQAA
mgnify:CR=1 FL=1